MVEQEMSKAVARRGTALESEIGEGTRSPAGALSW